MYRVILADEQRQQLNQRAHQAGIAPSTRDRLEMVRLSDAGWRIPQIAVHLNQYEQTVRYWIKAFFAMTLPTSYGWYPIGQTLPIPYEAPQGRRVHAIGAYCSHGVQAGTFVYATYASVPKSTAKKRRKTPQEIAASHQIDVTCLGPIDGERLVRFLWRLSGRPLIHAADWCRERRLWSRLTQAMAYATEAHLFITDLNQSPFNVGTRLILEDFLPGEVAELNRRYNSPLQNEAELAHYNALVGGHPYLARRGLHTMVTRGLDITALETQTLQEDGLFSDHLRRMRLSLQQDAGLRDAVRNILRGQLCPSREASFRLQSTGILAGHSLEEARLRCKLYQTYLETRLP